MGNCCVTPGGGGEGGGKNQKQPKQKKGKKPNPFSIEYNRSAPPGPKLVVLREPTGRDMAARYELGGELGRGEFGVTYLCTERATGDAFACKSISKKKLRTAVDIEDVRREVEIMRHLPKHPNIVSLRDTYEDDNAVHLVMELCEGGELFDRIVARGHYTERAAAVVTRTVVEVVQICHKHGVMHRDLKPENFLFANKKETAALKTIDFGLSVFFTPGERFTEIVGSPYYMAPEVLKRNYGPEVDVWSAGVILYILLCGVPPFWAETEQGVAQAIIRSFIDFKRDPWPRVSDNAKDLVRGMLNPDPKRRLNAQQVLDHPWLQNIKKAPNVNLGETVKARLQQFSVMNKFKKHALRVIAEHLSVEEVAGIKDMFEKMDLNKDNMINFDELKLGLHKLGHQMPDADVQILMEADVLDQVTPMTIVHFGGTILNKFLQLFDGYVETFIKVLPGASEDDNVVESKESVEFKIVSEKQQLALIGAAYTIADELLPAAVSKIFYMQTEKKGTSGSSEGLGPGSIYSIEYKEWKRHIQRSLDKLRDHFCRQCVLSFIYLEGKSRLDARMYLEGKSDDLFWDPDPLPSLPFQALFERLQQLASVAGDVLLGEKIQKVLLSRLTETVVFWLSNEQEFWDVFEDESIQLQPSGLQQLILDMHFIVEIAVCGRYRHRPVQKLVSGVITRAIAAFSAREVDLQSALPEDKWFLDTAKVAIQKLMLGSSGSESELEVSDSEESTSTPSTIGSEDSFASANNDDLESPVYSTDPETMAR